MHCLRKGIGIVEKSAEKSSSGCFVRCDIRISLWLSLISPFECVTNVVLFSNTGHVYGLRTLQFYVRFFFFSIHVATACFDSRFVCDVSDQKKAKENTPVCLFVFKGCAFVTLASRQSALNAIRALHHSMTAEVSPCYKPFSSLPSSFCCFFLRSSGFSPYLTWLSFQSNNPHFLLFPVGATLSHYHSSSMLSRVTLCFFFVNVSLLEKFFVGFFPGKFFVGFFPGKFFVGFSSGKFFPSLSSFFFFPFSLW